MIKQIKSKKVELPVIFLIENEEDWKELPRGLPYIIGTQEDLPFITLYLEFQTLLKSCKSTGIPINWENVLRRLGYSHNLRSYKLCSGGSFWGSSEGHTKVEIDDFIEDQYVVNFDRLSKLKILPKWLDDLKSSVEQNIIDEVMFDPTAFNKQLGLNVGNGIVKHNQRNLIINDVSGSIPDGVVGTTSRLIKLMSKKFYADIIITGGSTYFVDYDDVQNTDFVALAAKAGRNNEGEMFAKIISEPKEYNTVIAFGDNDSPQSYLDHHKINCKFKVETLYSLHTDKRSENIVGYARCLKPTNKPLIVKDWIETIN